jgi:long-chain acyl-CoA synthetase
MERNAKTGATRRPRVKQDQGRGKRFHDAEGADSPERAWLKAYPADIDWHARFEPGLLTDLFEQAVAAYADRPCTYFLGRRLSYAQIGALADRAAKGLQALGVGKGSKVGLLLPNTPSYIVYYFGILKAGGTVVNFNPLYSVEEIENQIRDSGTEIMISLDLALTFDKVAAALKSGVLKRAVIGSFAALLPRLKSAVLTLWPGSRLAKSQFAPGDDRLIAETRLLDNDGRHGRPDLVPDDIAVLQYTGGTTGIPKAAMLSHANLTINVRQIEAWWPKGADGQERIIGVLPFFHVFAMTSIMNLGISEGMEIILVPKFDLLGTLKLIHRLKPTMMPGVPTLYGAMIRYGKIGRFDLTSLQFCISGGAPLPLEIKHGFEAIASCHLVEGYGLSETSPVATCNPLDRPPKEGSIGIPLPATELSIRSLEDPEKVMPFGEPGEICIAGPQVMRGYWRNREETAASFVGRFFRTGDIGIMDEDGYLFIVDRIKDMINVSGFKVYPRRIEDALYTHPAVDEVTVVGIPDAYRGEAPKAFVKLKAGAEADAEALLAHLNDKLSKLELPAEIEFRAELPKTMVGKLSKKELAREARAKMAPAAIKSRGGI